ncbi:polyphosphate polymerase domain-containing protein [Alloiococcus sp. CFN-8]|uniref:polyphosphate polymerase domain-containing protein n=1 Tax=Alloiococcus sp. CFN-8 TaxID=3416081 RepID=UPI003CEFBBFB
MSKAARYRHELKYEISYLEYIPLRQRLRAVMDKDSYADTEGQYKISSLYFDNYNDKALKEKVEGAPKREKFRIRYYNGDTSFMKLEKKMKINGLCMKHSCSITKDECERLLSGDYSWMLDSGRGLIQEFYTKIISQQLRPRTMVMYTREPYIYDAGNVRVTFDMNISTGLYATDFLKGDIEGIPAPTDGRIVLEIKYDDYMPELIRDIVQVGVVRAEAFSKYAASRQYEL